MTFDAAIFDMDGLLLESESLWRQAEGEAVARLGIPLTDHDFEQTMGIRMRDVAKIWFDQFPWDGPTTDEVADQVIDRVIELAAAATPLPGVLATLDFVKAAGLRVALCSSSDDRLITAATTALGIADRFELAHSAEHDDFGKPHPQPYLTTATKLGVDPRRCIAFEDSVVGCLAAKSAGMTVVAVPDGSQKGSDRFGFADLVLESLTQFDDTTIPLLEAGQPIPSGARPRFHLAFPVTDLEAARHFYGDVLGCSEGRSAEDWVDFDLFGHQIVAHLVTDAPAEPNRNLVDGHAVPSEHFGLLLHRYAWERLVAKMKDADVTFLMEPTVRFAGEPGEQRTCFVIDPSGNALEFKAFADDRAVFRT